MLGQGPTYIHRGLKEGISYNQKERLPSKMHFLQDFNIPCDLFTVFIEKVKCVEFPFNPSP
jgi:hypothetical protein